MNDLPEIVAAFAMFGVAVVCPLVWMLIKHQRAMAEIMHRSAGQDTERRILALEREVMDLRAAHHERVLRELDEPQQLRNRIE